ncbi:MAG: proton-conducting transporter membrane subunit [Thermodesulfobacteriaceae bacterium]
MILNILYEPIQLSIFLILMGFIFFIVSLLFNLSVRSIISLNALLLLFAIVVSLNKIMAHQPILNNLLFIASIFSLVIYCSVLLIIVLLPSQLRTPKHVNELSFLFLLAAALMNILLYSSNYVYAYLLIEAIAFSFYLFIAYYSRTLSSVESAIKYYFVGTLTAIIFLLGVFFFYRATLVISFDQFNLIYVTKENFLLLIIGIILISTALAFKLGAAPLHFWLPEVYHGAPFYSLPMVIALSKLTIGYFLVSYLGSIYHNLNIDFSYVKGLFYFLAVLSMILGNLLAIKQKDVKKILAYSSVANVGYLFSLLTIDISDHVISVYASYLLIYSLSVFFFFLVLSFFIKDKQTIYLSLQDFSSNLAHANIFIIISLFLITLNLAGFPPTLGFLLKLSIVYQLISHNQIVLASIFVLTTILSVYYYWAIISCLIESIKRIQIRVYLPFSEILLTLVVLFIGLYFLVGIFTPNVIPFFK